MPVPFISCNISNYFPACSLKTSCLVGPAHLFPGQLGGYDHLYPVLVVIRGSGGHHTLTGNKKTRQQKHYLCFFQCCGSKYIEFGCRSMVMVHLHFEKKNVLDANNFSFLLYYKQGCRSRSRFLIRLRLLLLLYCKYFIFTGP